MTLSTAVVTAVNNDDADGVSTNFVIRNRTLAHKGRSEIVDMLGITPLSTIDTLLYDVSTRQNAKDITTTLDKVQVYFKDGEMRATFNKQDYKFLTSGASQLAQLVLPSRHWPGLKTLTTLKAYQGEELATKTWEAFASRHVKKMYVIRCVRIRNDDKSTGLAIRAIVSPTYGLYSNREFVQDLSYNTTEFGSIPVLEFTLTDQAMRINFVPIDSYTSVMSTFAPELLEVDPLPIISAWNSEVGRGKIGLRAGLYNAVTNGGIGHWDDSTEFSWIHRGGSGGMTLRTSIGKAFARLLAAATEVIKAYRDTKHIMVTNPEGWIREQMSQFDSLPDNITSSIIAALASERVTPGNKLATILDAMTLIGGKEKDIFRKADIEAAAARVMRRGIELAGSNKVIQNNK